MPQKQYDCLFIKTSTDSDLMPTQMIKAIKTLKNQELLAFDTGALQNIYDFCAQGFATVELLSQLDFSINELLDCIMEKYNPEELGSQEFNIVMTSGHKFSVLIQ